MDWKDSPAPTHRCKVCGALWRFWRQEETPHARDDSWSCHTLNIMGKCCDMAAMREQIEPVTLGQLLQYLQARIAVDTMVQSVAGPKDGDPIQ
jgi:hypothetical protein